MTTPDVELRLPAQSAYVAVLRTTAAGLAARLDFTLEEIEDLRMAVGEAAAVALENAHENDRLEAAFWLGSGRLRTDVTLVTPDPQQPDPSSFAWMLLSALSEASLTVADGRMTVSLMATSMLGSQFSA
jgi:serine/threonine-protein kinase RsbW